jgi:uncharacterized membrane protein required for colicin V production
MLGGHLDFVRYFIFLLQFIFFLLLMFRTTKIYHWISSKLKRDRENPQKVMKYYSNKILIWEGSNPSSISDLIDDES